MIHSVTASDLRRLYVGAAKLINRFGWWSCGLGDVNTGFCVVGAIDEYYNRYDPPYGTRNIAIAYLESLVSSGEPLHKWNDRVGGRYVAIDYLHRAAETAELGIERFRDHTWK